MYSTMEVSVENPVVIREDMPQKEPNSNIKSSSITKQKLLMSSALVVDANDGVLLLSSSSDYINVRIYFLYRHIILKYILYCAIFLNHFIILFEKRNQNDSKLNSWTISIELFCLLIYTIRLCHSLLVLPSEVFWCDKKNITVATAIFMTICDIIFAFVVPDYVRWSPMLRPLFIINFAENKQIRRAFRNIRNTLPDVLNVLILFFLSILTFSIIGLKLFEKQAIYVRNNGISEKYFSNFFDIFYHLYILVTTANNPDVMMPAYNKSRWFAIYFVIYLITNLYLFMNIILAVIYNNYRKHLKVEIRNLLKLKRDNLMRAFNLLTNNVEDTENSTFNDKDSAEKGVTQEVFAEMMQIVLNAEGSEPTHRSSLISIYWSLLETNQMISKENFLQLTDLLSFYIKITSNSKNVTIFEKLMKSVYQCKLSRMFRIMVKSKIFRYCFDSLILFNAIVIAFDYDYSYIEWGLLLIFTFEILAKVYTFGFYLFIQKFWNIFDLLVIGMAVILWLIIESNQSMNKELEQYLDLLLILRVLRLCKIITTIKRFKIVVKTVLALVPSFASYIGLLFVVYYCYAIIGMRLFVDLRDDTENGCKNDNINCCRNQTLQANYCSINFNTFPNAMLFLFDLMVVNQWHILAKSQELLLESKLTRIYFISFHLICVILVLNIFTAFVLEAFILEYIDITDKKPNKSIFQQRLEQIGLHCAQKRKESVNNCGYSEMEDLVDADHDFIDINNYSDEQQYNSGFTFKISDLRVFIREKKSVELLLIKMFRNEISIESTNSTINDTQNTISAVG